ncbi:MAG: hypothetical protein A2Y17_11500 [Clostridiales bacterium GWF2_38_85]|nr:MAG: hypothetical protein A2Y17_11500 [Clostridiales bacterium GWF2_38_85]HBL85098.1 hypothetical protein [Clostridiales bacterium]
MDQTRIDMYLMSNKKFFPDEAYMMLRDRLLNADENKLMLLQSVEMKDPTTILIISIFLGSLGIDRFMLGDTGMGILKLLTCGCCGILTIIDWFTISKKAKDINLKNAMMVIG